MSDSRPNATSSGASKPQPEEFGAPSISHVSEDGSRLITPGSGKVYIIDAGRSPDYVFDARRSINYVIDAKRSIDIDTSLTVSSNEIEAGVGLPSLPFDPRTVEVISFEELTNTGMGVDSSADFSKELSELDETDIRIRESHAVTHQLRKDTCQDLQNLEKVVADL